MTNMIALAGASAQAAPRWTARHHGLGQATTATGQSRGQTLAVSQSPCVKDGRLRYR
jgi:hypothetical protein